MPNRTIRDVSLFVEVIGHGQPIVLMHGGPGADHWTMAPFRRLADRFTLVFYDHRCNGRSKGAELTSLTWENLTADADALREQLGFDRWAVLGHSFGGNVALEYALRYPDRVSHLILLDTGGDSRWAHEHAPALLARRGFSAKTVALARRFLNGQIQAKEFVPALIRLGPAYDPHISLRQLLGNLIQGAWRSKLRPKALIYAAPRLLTGWTVMDRLGEIKVPTLVMAGRDDFIFPPEHQGQLAAGIPGARLRIIERAGHNPHAERPDAVMEAVREFITADASTTATAAAAHPGSAGDGTHRRHPVAVAAVKTVHTAIFLVELASIAWLAVSGLLGRRDRTVAVATGAVGLEVAVFLANDGVCPLTPLAERLGSVRGSVSDIFLPDAVARTIPVWSTALLVIGAVLHARSALRDRGSHW
jgi:pimeloyl-ACP methyl ester carboxylesterase